MAHFIIRTHRRPWGRRYTWLLISDNGEPVCQSEPYNSENAARHGIAVVKSISRAAQVKVEDR